MSNEERQKYKDLVEAAKEEVAKHKDLFPVEPNEVKINAAQLRKLGWVEYYNGRCTFLNQALCKWLVGKFDPVSRSLTVHGRTFVVTESHVHDCLGINAQGNVIDLEGNTSDSCEEVCINLGMRNGVVQLKDLKEYLDKTEEVHEVFYLERVSPTVKPSIRKFPSLVVWGDGEIKTVLHQFDKIGGYDREGVVVHFTEVGEGNGNEGGVSQISTTDVQTMTSTFVTVAGLLLRQNMFMAKLLGYEIQGNPQGEMSQGLDVNNVQLMGQVATLLKGLHSCQISPPTVFETPDPAIENSKGLSTNPSLGRHIGFETASPFKVEQEMAQENYVDPVHPFAKSSPRVTTQNISETLRPNLFKTPEPVVEQSKGPDTRTVAKRRIQVDVDEDVCSPSPVKEFRSLVVLSRGRKRKLEFGNPVPYVGGYDNVEVHYEPPRLRQADQLKKSHFQHSPFTKDGVKKRNPPKKQPMNDNFDKLNVNVPIVCIFSSFTYIVSLLT
ncbi:hypothetical protein RHMOL_Rhmol10G0159000 [Rhododendron molle]|uniref:Uncharacterized protein n=1 Tax=Rhododendron molle TaxID=49168 RepID=A0ACC0M2H1_RHOML|nr:hypothetical protein RHMOL_Rhmol10G0159000 [Rhododendron molle]